VDHPDLRGFKVLRDQLGKMVNKVQLVQLVPRARLGRKAHRGYRESPVFRGLKELRDRLVLMVQLDRLDHRAYREYQAQLVDRLVNRAQPDQLDLSVLSDQPELWVKLDQQG
jgi:hypothetical protein